MYAIRLHQCRELFPTVFVRILFYELAVKNRMRFNNNWIEIRKHYIPCYYYATIYTVQLGPTILARTKVQNILWVTVKERYVNVQRIVQYWKFAMCKRGNSGLWIRWTIIRFYVSPYMYGLVENVIVDLNRFKADRKYRATSSSGLLL